MDILIFLGGVFLGFILSLLIKDNTKTYGIMLVDHKNELCKVKISSDELLDRRVKNVVLKVEETDLSREEQAL